MKLALECPTELLGQIQPYADFDFLLAHLVLTDHAYAEFYMRNERARILDNSVNELGTPLSIEEMRRASIIVKPDVIVAPDHLRKVMETIYDLDRCREEFEDISILPVLQGPALYEVLVCAQFIFNRGFTDIAVPYDIACERSESIQKMSEMRATVVGLLSSKFSFNIHLLGFLTLGEFSHYKGNPKVKSLDTGSPVMHGLLGLEFGKDLLLDKSQPTMDRMVDNNNLDLAIYNIGFLKDILKDSGGRA